MNDKTVLLIVSHQWEDTRQFLCDIDHDVVLS